MAFPEERAFGRLKRYRSAMRRALLAVPMGLLMLIVACSGGGGDSGDTTVRPIEAIAERIVIDDLPLTRSTVRVRFNGPVEPVSMRALTTAFSLTQLEDSALAGQPLGEMPIEGVELSQTSSRIVTLTVANVIVSGSRLHVANSAFKEGATGESVILITSRFSETGVILAAGALRFGDLRFVEERPPEVPTAADRDSSLVRTALEEHLAARGASEPVRIAALALYDNMPETIVPAPKARAALAAMRGTFVDASVDSFLTSSNCTGLPTALIDFQEPPGDANLAARVTFTEDGRRVVSLRPDLEAAPFELLMTLLAHEAVHCDRFDGPEEEIVAAAFDVFLYIHLLLSRPDLALDSSPLARNLNVEAVAMLNSGRALPESLGILPSPHGREVLPGSGTAFASFAELIASSYAGDLNSTSPVEPVAQSYVDAIAMAAGLPFGTAFDLEYIDSLLAQSVTFDTVVALLTLFDLVLG